MNEREPRPGRTFFREEEKGRSSPPSHQRPVAHAVSEIQEDFQ